jgi:hypothetical protein
MLERLTRALSEIRLDIHEADQAKLRLGLTLTVATLVVVASGWPPGEMVDHALFFVLGALPLAAIGLALVVGQLIHARADRDGHRRADDREVRALRALILAETRGCERRAASDVEAPTASLAHSPGRRRPPESARFDGHRRQRLVARRRARAPFRSGYLHLR